MRVVIRSESSETTTAAVNHAVADMNQRSAWAMGHRPQSAR